MIYKVVEGYLVAHYLLDPDTHFGIIEAYREIQVSQKAIDRKGL